MPAEWERHSATWLTWPHDDAHWPGLYDRIPPIFAHMVKELESGEDVHIGIHDDETEGAAKKAMKNANVQGDRVQLHRIPNNFSWARDHGPIFLKHADGRTMMVDWKFNGWGNKWDFTLDDDVPKFIETITKIERVDGPMVLEGGSIDVNGKGTLLTTSSCLLHPNRNPQLTKEQIEQNLQDYLGVTNVLWLGGEIQGDDTNGHIDDLTRFVGPRTILTVTEKDESSMNYVPLQKNLETLKTMNDQDGNLFEILEVPLPKPVIHEESQLPASYANFYIGNDVVLLTVFDDPNDQIAVDTLARCFPTRKIVPILSRDLIWGFGAFHCLTQQQPV